MPTPTKASALGSLFPGASDEVRQAKLQRILSNSRNFKPAPRVEEPSGKNAGEAGVAKPDGAEMDAIIGELQGLQGASSESEKQLEHLLLKMNLDDKGMQEVLAGMYPGEFSPQNAKPAAPQEDETEKDIDALTNDREELLRLMTDQEGENWPNIDWQEKVHRGILRESQKYF